MSVSDTGSGKRVITLTLNEGDLDKLTGGTAAVDKSVRSRLPEVISYSGLKSAADGGATTTFTLEFNSTSDYKDKVAKLLDAGEVRAPTSDFSVSDSILVNGIVLEEDFSSAELLSWMFEGLVADGIVAQGDAGSMYEIGTSEVVFDGVTTPQSGNIRFRADQNNGFDSVSVSTQIQDENHVSRTITYVAENERFAENRDLLASFIAESAPEGSVVNTPSEGTWEVAFEGNPANIETSTRKAMGGGDVNFTLSLEDSTDDPAEKTLVVVNTVSCDAVCATSEPIIDLVTMPHGYTPGNAEINTSHTTPTLFTLSPPLTSVAAKFAFGAGGAVKADVAFVVPRTSLDVVGDGFAKKLAPLEGSGSLSVDESESGTTYTVSIAGKDVNELADRYQMWAPDSYISAEKAEGGLLLQRSLYTVSPGLHNLVGRHPVANEVTADLDLPFGQWASGEDNSLSISGVESGFSVEASGLNVGGVVALIVLLIAGIGGSGLAFRNRLTIKARLRSMKGQVDGALVEQQLLTNMASYGASTTPTITVGSLIDRAPGSAQDTSKGSLLDLPKPADRSRDRTGGSLLDMQPGTSSSAWKPSLLDRERRPSTEPRPSLFDRTSPKSHTHH